MRHRLIVRQWVPYPVSDVFRFFSDPNNLPPLMPRWQRPRIDRTSLILPEPRDAEEQATAERAAGAGSRILLSFRPVPLLPWRMQWDAEIAEFSWDDHFCDAQRSGPFGYWLHCHRVQAQTRKGKDGTLVTDDVCFAFPLGPLGEAAYWLGGALQVQALFHYRQQQLPRLLPGYLRRVKGGAGASAGSR